MRSWTGVVRITFLLLLIERVQVESWKPIAVNKSFTASTIIGEREDDLGGVDHFELGLLESMTVEVKHAVSDRGSTSQHHSEYASTRANEAVVS